MEARTKIPKTKSVLGAEWEVAAPVGHIRDLPGKELGIDKVATR
jgi:DNA topoisomerase-1